MSKHNVWHKLALRLVSVKFFSLGESTVSKADQLIEAEFEFVCDYEGNKVFRTEVNT